MDAYMFQADLYCSDCIIEEMISAHVLSPAARDMSISDVFEQHMSANGWENEADYDSDEFAKGPFADGVGEADSEQHCGRCGVALDNMQE